MKVLATYNIKGGVGKTATAVNLAHVAAAEGNRVLVWDLDPQGAATFYFRVKPKVKGGGKAIVRGSIELGDAIKATDFDNLDLVPADFSYRHLDLWLDDAKKPLARIRRALLQVSHEYDYIFLDCPPSISLTSESVFRAADALLVPTIPTTLSLRTYEQLDRFVEENPDMVRELKILGFFSMVDRHKRLHRRFMTELRTAHPEMLEGTIPNSTDIERMGVHREPIGSYGKGSRAARSYESLWSEIQTRL
ncbi:MAG: ParA family protein [Actinobacteria bacterium]|jgi:chromosome partitioning protein|nr:ParA family protein [Acidimicrobiia bacterium]MCX6510407.1 ParA family protein [Actinomycetota bacterium]